MASVTSTTGWVDDYLVRIGVTRPVAADLQALRDLQLSHLLAVPFENLSIHLVQRDGLRPGAVTAQVGGDSGGEAADPAVVPAGGGAASAGGQVRAFGGHLITHARISRPRGSAASAGSTRPPRRCAASPGCPAPQPSDTHIRQRSGTLSTGIIS
jgi:hypothetical protein